MPIKLAVVMDPIQSITPQKDSTLAMLLEAQQRDWQISYCQPHDLQLQRNKPYGYMRRLSVNDDEMNWFILGEERLEPLGDFDVILMRKDPPFDIDYVYTTYFLERAEAEGALVVNKPAGLRDANEKLAALWFPECTPPSLVSSKHDDILHFLDEHNDIVIKPLGGMGGSSVFRLAKGDINTNVAIETVTEQGQSPIMVQRYIPEISAGDKRILMINGEPIPYALARIPQGGDLRGNLAKGAQAEGMPLSEKDQWICERVGATLREKGLLFVGLDVIGEYLTEVNVTSPTCIRELDNLFDLNISATLLDCIEAKLKE